MTKPRASTTRASGPPSATSRCGRHWRRPIDAPSYECSMLKDLLTGRLALVTGAGRGNGAAIARGLADAGARVIVTDIDIEAAHAMAESIVKAGGEARGYALDVTDHEGCRKLAEDIALLVGPIRILVNNAGIFLRGNIGGGWPRALGQDHGGECRRRVQ